MTETHEPLAFAVGDRLSVRRAITLPATCMKCGDSADARSERAFFFVAPWMYALLVLGPFGALGLLALTKTAALAVPLCAACDARWNAVARARKVVTIVAVALTLAAIFWPLLAPGAASAIAAVVVTVAAFVAIVVVYLTTSSRVMRAVSIDAERIAVTGVHPSAMSCARDATPGPALAARATTRLAARLLAAHVLAYVLALAWAVAAIPIVVQSLPKNLDDDPTLIGALVLRKVMWPFAGVWVAVHLASLPWAFTKNDARLKWTRTIFIIAASGIFVAAALAGGLSWWRLMK